MAIKEKIEASKSKLTNKALHRILLYALFFAMGFILSTGSVINQSRPFALSLIAVSKKKYFLFAAAGAGLGYLIGGVNPEFARYLSAVVLACLGAFACSAFDLRKSPAFPMTVAFLADFATGFVLNFRLQSSLYSYFLVLGEAILASAGAFFFYRSLNSSYKRLRFRALPVSDIACIIISACIIMLNLSSFYIGIFCPAAAVAMLIILTAVRFGSDKWGVILALCFGFVLSIANENALFIIGALAFSALTATLFSSFSSLGVGFVFLCSTGFFSIADGTRQGLSLFIEGLCAVVLLLILPEKVRARLEEMWESSKDAPTDGSLRQTLVLKLRFASSAMAAISESVDEVRERINQITRKENDSKRNTISREEYVMREIILEKTNQIRMVASDEFFSISGMLDDLAAEFDEAEMFDSNASAKIRRLLGDYDIYPSNISVIEDKFSRVRVEILTDSDTVGLTNPDLRRDIGKICSRYFENGQITRFKDEAMLSFTERPLYRLMVGFAQHSAEGKMCGDTVKVINDNKGHSILIISDGMGRGSRAALDGAMGAGLLSRLLNAGFGFDSALKVVNSALLVKSNDESLATLDIANIDLFTGKCEMLKAGAAASYIIKENRLEKCELTSMPAGILRGIEFARRTAVLSPGSCIAMMSDGITDLGEDWVRSTLEECSSSDAQKCADNMLNKALAETQSKKRDDMTVIFARLERN